MRQRFQKILKSTHPPMRMAGCKAWLGVQEGAGLWGLGRRQWEQATPCRPAGRSRPLQVHQLWGPTCFLNEKIFFFEELKSHQEVLSLEMCVRL